MWRKIAQFARPRGAKDKYPRRKRRLTHDQRNARNTVLASAGLYGAMEAAKGGAKGFVSGPRMERQKLYKLAYHGEKYTPLTRRVARGVYAGRKALTGGAYGGAKGALIGGVIVGTAYGAKRLSDRSQRRPRHKS